MLKKLAILFLLTILLFQAGGLLLCNLVEQKLVQLEMKEQLEHEDALFEKISISKKEYEANKRSYSEIAIDHKLYDIKSKTIKGDSVHLLVINDTKEKQIEAQIEAYFDGNENLNKGRSDKAKQIKKLFELQYLFPKQSDLVLNNYWKTISYPKWKESLTISNLNIVAPPPRRA
jgi:hypothetical protein